MKKIIQLGTLFFLSLNLEILASEHACKISMKEKILVLSNSIENLHPVDFFTESNCQKETINQIAKLLIKVNGNLRQDSFHQTFPEELNGIKVEINQRSFQVVKLEELIFSNTRQINHKYFSVNNLRPVGNRSFIGLKKNQDVNIICQKCDSAGEKNIKIIYYDEQTNRDVTVWVTAVFLERTALLRSKRAIMTQSSDLEKNFELQTADVENPSEYFRDFERIKFYKTNKQIDEGELLKACDLIAMNLVNYNSPVKIIFKANNLRVQAEGISKQSGKIGDEIKVLNPKSKKELIGKITDFNTVEAQI